MMRRGLLLIAAGAAAAWLMRRQGILGSGRPEVLPWQEDREGPPPAPVEPRPVESTTEEVATEAGVAAEEPPDDNAVSEAGIVDAEVVAEPRESSESPPAPDASPADVAAADAPTVEADALSEADLAGGDPAEAEQPQAPGAAGVADVVDDLLTAPVRPPEDDAQQGESPANDA